MNRLAGVGVLVVGAAGCQGGDSRFAGAWVGTSPLEDHAVIGEDCERRFEGQTTNQWQGNAHLDVLD